MFIVTSREMIRAPEERHQGMKADVDSSGRLVTLSIHHYKHRLAPEPIVQPSALRSALR